MKHVIYLPSKQQVSNRFQLELLSDNNALGNSSDWHISISQSEVVEELLMLNVHKACGPDQMCPRLLKEGAEQLPHFLMKLFNHSISNGVLPQDILYIRKEISIVLSTTDLLV